MESRPRTDIYQHGGYIILQLNQIIRGNCLEVLPTLPEASIDCCVTSPPYWQQREYHDVEITYWPEVVYRPMPGIDHEVRVPPMGCVHGNEGDLESYVAHEVLIFREAYRVLADHGTLWLNLGDPYDHQKNLCGMPWRVALALQADGWILRRDNIWHKPSPMPESGGRAFVTYWVDKQKNRIFCPTCQGKGCIGNPLCWQGWRMKWAGLDRCTTAHEYLFHFAKSETAFFDAEAIKEPQSESTLRNSKGRAPPMNPKALQATKGEERANSTFETTAQDTGGRQKRDVWTIAAEAVKEKHFAAFPCKLVEPCILAGCPREVCRVCGKPRMRVVETVRRPTRPGEKTKLPGCNSREYIDRDPSHSPERKDRIPSGWDTGPGGHTKKAGRYDHSKEVGNRDPERHVTERVTLGWTDCGHGGDYRKGIVLDPFAGTGRVGVVATHLDRDYYLIELSETYIETIADVYLTSAQTGVTVKEIHNGQGILFGD